jgi:predicted extracellular nuclease
VEGSSNNKALEIFNPLAVAVNLADYTVRLYNNGASTPNTSLVLSGTLAPGATLVIANPSAGAALLALAQRTSGVCGFNGDDALVLEKGGAVIDAIGQVGFDPGTQWSAGGVATLDRTLRRKAGIAHGEATATDVFDPSLEWDGFAIDDFSGLGLR